MELAVLDVELRGEGALVDVLRRAAQVGVDPVVGDPTAQLRAVDDRGDLSVHPVRDQDGAGQAAQRLLGRGGPLLLAGAHLQQLGGEGQLGGRDAHLGGDVVAEGHILGVEVRGAGGEGGELLAGAGEGLPQVADGRLRFPAGRVGALLLGLEALPQRQDLALQGQEHVLPRRGAQLDGRQLGGELGAPLTAPLPFDLEARDLLLPVIDLAAAGALALLLELGEIGAGLGDILAEATLLGGEPVAFELEPVGLIPEQPHQMLGGEDVDIGATVHQLPAARTHRGPVLVVPAQAAQQVPLLTSGHQRFVHLGEVVEVRERLIGQFEGARRVEHVVAQQPVDVPELLGGLDLVQQAQRLLVRDAQQLAERGAVLAELAEGLGARVGGLKGLALDLGGDELAQVGDVQRGPRDDVEALDVGVRGVTGVQQEQARELDGAALAVAVAQREHRQGGLLPQHLLAELAGGLVVVHRPGTAHIAGHSAAVLRTLRPGIRGRSVELQGAGRGEQCADRIQQGRLPGAGTAGEEVALGGDLQIVRAMEGPPVGDLHGDQPPLPRMGVVGVDDRPRGHGLGGNAGQIQSILPLRGHGLSRRRHPVRVPSPRTLQSPDRGFAPGRRAQQRLPAQCSGRPRRQYPMKETCFRSSPSSLTRCRRRVLITPASPASQA